MKLRGLPSRLGRLPHRLPMPGDGDRARDAAQPWRAWYHTERWRKLRAEVLERDLYTCQWPGCGVMLRSGRWRADAAVVDHIVPASADLSRFWDPANLQALCKACHDGAKQAAEKRGA